MPLRQRMLRDMGIEVWHLRAPIEKTAGSGLGVAVSGLARADGSIDPPTFEPPPLKKPRSKVESPAGTQGNAPIARRPPASSTSVQEIDPDGYERQKSAHRLPASSASAQATDPPYSVVALGAPGVLLVVDAFAGRGDATLAGDIVRAVCRDWVAPVRQARFDWPQPGASGASAPALVAFVEKQMEDCGAKQLLVTESAVRHLGDCARDFVPVPDLSSLGDGEAKLALWQRLRELPSP